MPHSEANDNVEQPSEGKILSLLAVQKTEIILSDLPVSRASITLREDIASLHNSIVYPYQLIGWIDFSSLTKLACLNQQHYFDAGRFIRAKQNQIFFFKPVKIHTVNADLNKSKAILTFSLYSAPLRTIVLNIKS
jgi:hypothetical protein